MRAVLGLVVVGFLLCGCATSNFGQNVKTMVEAGCKGALHVEASAASAAGLSPGSANGRISFDGSCDPADKPLAP